MAIYTNEELLEQLRAIGWRDQDISNSYPELLPYYKTGEPSTLYERLLTIGWSEQRIREEHPEILPASEGGILEVVGDPVYTLGPQAGQPIERDPDPHGGFDPGSGPVDTTPGGIEIMPVGLPDEWDGTVPDVAEQQTADLMLLGLIFL